MGISERRERERLKLRTRILDTARTLFVRDGYEAVTMRKIADRIEYSATALYSHFENKEALIRELCALDFAAFSQIFLKIGQIADPVERLREAGNAYVTFALKHPEQYRLMFMTATPPPVNPDELGRGNPEQDAYAFLKWTAEEALGQGRLRPELKDAELISQTLWAGIHGMVALHITKGTDEWLTWRPLRARAGAMVDALMHGLVTDARARGR
jgi:AcrR family transcriptional regulator